MREIGGYFEWEMSYGTAPLHPQATLLLKSARSSVGLLLQVERPRRLRVPYYICDEALELVDLETTEIDYYALDSELEIAGGIPDLPTNECLVYLNYFGLKSDYVQQLETRYREQLWVDDVQAFYYVPEDSLSYHFNSARKFFGVPDGSYLYAPVTARAKFEEIPLPVNTDYRLEHLTLRLAGETLAGHRVFQENDRLASGPIAAISAMGRAMLGRIDYPAVARRRRENYLYLHAALGSHNQLSQRVLDLDVEAVPYCYPYLPSQPLAREPFWERGLFIPTLWQECGSRVDDGFALEKKLTASMLPLPVDQRYGGSDLDRVIDAIRMFSS